MGFDDIVFWPFAFAFGGALIILGILLVIFWIWMLIDCAKRKYRNGVEKVVWVLVIIFMGWIGALIYFIIIRSINPKGLAKK